MYLGTGWLVDTAAFAKRSIWRLQQNALADFWELREEVDTGIEACFRDVMLYISLVHRFLQHAEPTIHPSVYVTAAKPRMKLFTNMHC